MGIYKIPSDMDLATKLILKEVGRLGVNLINKEGTEIIITLEDFKRFWKKVGEFNLSSMLGVHYGHYEATNQTLFEDGGGIQLVVNVGGSLWSL
jgi:hypothetical protein